MNEIKSSLNHIEISNTKKAQMHNQLFSKEKTYKTHYHIKGTAVAACLIIFAMMSSVVYAAYSNGVMDKLFALNSEKQFEGIADDVYKIEEYMSNEMEPISVGDYKIQILGHLVNTDLQMGIIYYSIENVNPDSKYIFSVGNVYDDPGEVAKSLYFGYQKEYKEDEVTDKTITSLVIPQNDPPEDYYVKSTAEGKLYIAKRYVTVDKPFTYLNLISCLGDDQREILGKVDLPSAKSLPTIVLTSQNGKDSGSKISLSAMGMKLENFDFENGGWQYTKENSLKILDKTQIKFKNQVVNVSDIKSLFTGSIDATDGRECIYQEFRLLLNLETVESVIVDGVEYGR